MTVSLTTCSSMSCMVTGCGLVELYFGVNLQPIPVQQSVTVHSKWQTFSFLLMM